MSNYTPTTDDAVKGLAGLLITAGRMNGVDAAAAARDWLAAHERAVKAEAWEEGKDAVWLDENDSRYFLSYDPNPYRKEQP